MEDQEDQAEEFDIVKWQEESPNVWAIKDENGIDLAQLQANLKLTPAERLRKHGIALELALRMKKAGEEYRQNRSRESS